MKTFTEGGICVQVEVPEREEAISRIKFSPWKRILGWYWKSVYTGIPFGCELGLSMPRGYPYRYPNRERVHLVLAGIFMVAFVGGLVATFILARDLFFTIVGTIVMVVVLLLAIIIFMFLATTWGEHDDDEYLGDY
jgi:hypothetical protein